jgi:SNF family Na+-dependent transporter
MSSLSPNNRPLQDPQGVSPRSNAVILLRWWYSVCAPPEVLESASFIAREQARRGRVASFIILGTLIAAMMLVPIIILAAPTMFFLPWAITSTVVGMLCCLVAIPLNRRRHIQPAGILLLIAVDVETSP